jgi:hypothetical protein
MLFRLAGLALLVLCITALAGCGSNTPQNASAGGGRGEVIDDETENGVDVPDLSGADGADAVSTVETEGLIATLADADDDPSFDSTRDATGCEVRDQEPVAGETVEDGTEITITVSCAQVDWENQKGPAWEAFDEAYTTGFDAGCDALFDQSPDGSLYEDDTEYTALDCQNENPGDASSGSDVPSDAPDDPEAAGTELGELDGCTALFDNGVVLSLNHGTDTWTDADCPL